MLRAVHESVRSVGCLCGRIASLDSRVIVISPWPGCVLLRDIFGRAHVHLGFGIQHCLACGTDQVGLLALLLASAHAFVHAQLGGCLSRSQTQTRASSRREVLALLPLAEALHAGSAEALDSALRGQKVVVLGGSGFVGRRICQRLVAEGAQVTSISRTGGPPSKVGDWASSVAWKRKDVLTADLVPEMTGAAAADEADDGQQPELDLRRCNKCGQISYTRKNMCVNTACDYCMVAAGFEGKEAGQISIHFKAILGSEHEGDLRGGTGYSDRELHVLPLSPLMDNRHGRNDSPRAVRQLIAEMLRDGTGIVRAKLEWVISAIGSIGSADDEQGNGATNEAAVAAAAKAGVKRFVLVSASKDVGEAGVDAIFGPYVKGKQRAEAAVKARFSDSSLVLQPSFIYGGDEFSATPPRVAGWYGEKVENLLATDLFRAVASASPAFLRLALSPPLAVDDVAKAAVAGAAGRASGTLESHDAILAAR
ncbi:hypothetical protein AK812_SmicGene17359 [Symbiodinium microadriaticum]|uniref:Uncharacterized protein n=1 Tax=Symbiodinium microadriaticum TaxID=2951 RepID=A0A1Q9DXY8_SYMMI|nr:hypothetical protein AK812_SmicGene17359 [Symbiodinium microadriaticum]